MAHDCKGAVLYSADNGCDGCHDYVLGDCDQNSWNSFDDNQDGDCKEVSYNFDNDCGAYVPDNNSNNNCNGCDDFVSDCDPNSWISDDDNDNQEGDCGDGYEGGDEVDDCDESDPYIWKPDNNGGNYENCYLDYF